MANTVYMSKTGLIGGEVTKLDSIDGAGLVDGDAAFVNVSNVQYIYRLDADSAAAESSPNIIAPDTNPGDKRWILQAPQGALNPLFYAYLTNTATDVTGDGTSYEMVGAIWTEVYDTNDCFSNGIFTAPHDGLYRFDCNLYIGGITSSHISYSLSPRIIPIQSYNSMAYMNLYAVSNLGVYHQTASQVIRLAESDEVSLEIQVAGGTKVIDIFGRGIQPFDYSYFSGHRIA